MIFSWAAIGTVVGLLLGLTGAGGAVIAVPLFVYLAGLTVRDATTLSLIAVLAGSLLNWVFQLKETDYRLSALLVVFSALGSFTFSPLKNEASEWLITGLFLAVTLWSLFVLWKDKGSTPDSDEGSDRPVEHRMIKGSAGGFVLGGLITMTGLGGGVMLIPLLKGVFKMPLTQAAATSLLTILASSAFSMWLQWERVADLVPVGPVLALIAGTIIAASGAKWISEKMQPEKLNRLRLWLISAVVVVSAGSMIVKTANSSQEAAPMKAQTLHMKDLKPVYEKLGPGEIILDVRTPEEFSEGHVPGAINIDHESVGRHATELSKHERIYVHCRSGKRAEMAVNELSSKGLKNLVLVKDSGMMDWTASGFPEQKGGK